MADLEEIAVSVAVRLQEIAQQAARLGAGLQNAAPADQAGTQNPSIQYLLAVSDVLGKSAKECIMLGPKHMHAPKPESED